ncbi:MAG TPA: response regulator [Methanobacterium sp.]|nr:response regulator [Methanobacterium sp.]
MLNKVIKVLLIEDNDADARLIKEMFKEISKPKYELIHFINLQEGLKALDKDTFDILLLDLSLPDSKGLETFEKAHEYDPKIPIVILSGLDDEEVAIKAVRQGAQDYLMKGDVNNRILSRALNYAIERKNVEKDLIESQNDLIDLIKKYTEELKKRGVGKIDGVEKRLDEKIHSFDKISSQSREKEENRSNINLFNEKVPKSLWLKVAEDFKEPRDKLSVSDKDIKVKSAETGDLENLVEIIKELGERGYFVEEHYVLDLDIES